VIGLGVALLLPAAASPTEEGEEAEAPEP